MIYYMNDLIVNVQISDAMFFSKVEGYGSMIDDLSDFKHSFVGGKIYGLIGECGSGGWGLSSMLCGKDSARGCSVMVNGIQVSMSKMKEWGWYVGEGMEQSGRFYKEKSVIKQIRSGLKVTEKCDEDEIIKLFGLSDRQLGSKLSKLSFERWVASVAIGYAYDFRIYCFPWLNTACLNDLIIDSRLHIYLDILKQEGNIVIIPTEKVELVEMIADEIIVIKNNRHDISPLVKKVIMDYHKNGPPI